MIAEHAGGHLFYFGAIKIASHLTIFNEAI